MKGIYVGLFASLCTWATRMHCAFVTCKATAQNHTYFEVSVNVKFKSITTDVLNVPQSALIPKFVSSELKKLWLKDLILITTEMHKTEQHSNLRRWRISLDSGFRHNQKRRKMRCAILIS